jgi:hypothetical protein
MWPVVKENSSWLKFIWPEASIVLGKCLPFIAMKSKESPTINHHFSSNLICSSLDNTSLMLGHRHDKPEILFLLLLNLILCKDKKSWRGVVSR